MRLLFFILLLVNAAVFAYLFFQEPGVRPSKPVLPALNADRVLLVQAESAAGKRGVASATTTCLSWRGLKPEALAQARAALEKLADGVKFSQPAGDEYWIYMAPLKNKRDGEKKLAELKALSIDDGVLLEESGKWQYAISFAAFPTEDDAIVRLNQLNIALSQNKNEPLAWLHRGALKAFLGDGVDALGDTVQARQLSPLDPWNYYFETLSSSAAFAAGDYREAVRLASSSMRANRMHVSTLRVLAMAHAELGLIDDAREYLKQVLAIEPTLTVSKYLSRSPSSGRRMAEICAGALRKAGLVE